MIKVHHTDYQLRGQSDFMGGFFARIDNRALKPEIKFLYPKWPLLATVIA